MDIVTLLDCRQFLGQFHHIHFRSYLSGTVSQQVEVVLSKRLNRCMGWGKMTWISTGFNWSFFEGGTVIRCKISEVSEVREMWWFSHLCVDYRYGTSIDSYLANLGIDCGGLVWSCCNIGWPVGFFLNRFNDCELCTTWKTLYFVVD